MRALLQPKTGTDGEKYFMTVMKFYDSKRMKIRQEWGRPFETYLAADTFTPTQLRKIELHCHKIEKPQIWEELAQRLDIVKDEKKDKAAQMLEIVKAMNSQKNVDPTVQTLLLLVQDMSQKIDKLTAIIEKRGALTC